MRKFMGVIVFWLIILLLAMVYVTSDDREVESITYSMQNHTIYHQRACIHNSSVETCIGEAFKVMVNGVLYAGGNTISAIHKLSYDDEFKEDIDKAKINTRKIIPIIPWIATIVIILIIIKQFGWLILGIILIIRDIFEYRNKQRRVNLGHVKTKPDLDALRKELKRLKQNKIMTNANVDIPKQEYTNENIYDNKDKEI